MKGVQIKIRECQFKQKTRKIRVAPSSILFLRDKSKGEESFRRMTATKQSDVGIRMLRERHWSFHRATSIQNARSASVVRHREQFRGSRKLKELYRRGRRSGRQRIPVYSPRSTDIVGRLSFVRKFCGTFATMKNSINSSQLTVEFFPPRLPRSFRPFSSNSEEPQKR